MPIKLNKSSTFTSVRMNAIGTQTCTFISLMVKLMWQRGGKCPQSRCAGVSELG